MADIDNVLEPAVGDVVQSPEDLCVCGHVRVVHYRGLGPCHALDDRYGDRCCLTCHSYRSAGVTRAAVKPNGRSAHARALAIVGSSQLAALAAEGLQVVEASLLERQDEQIMHLRAELDCAKVLAASEPRADLRALRASADLPIAELRRLLARMTQAAPGDYGIHTDDDQTWEINTCRTVVCSGLREADADAICSLLDHAPALLDEVERLTSRLRAAEGMLLRERDEARTREERMRSQAVRLSDEVRDLRAEVERLTRERNDVMVAHLDLQRSRDDWREEAGLQVAAVECLEREVDCLTDESLRIAEALGVDTSGDYDLVEAAAAVVRERDRSHDLAGRALDCLDEVGRFASHMDLIRAGWRRLARLRADDATALWCSREAALRERDTAFFHRDRAQEEAEDLRDHIDTLLAMVRRAAREQMTEPKAAARLLSELAEIEAEMSETGGDGR